jgi:hypothetical protein
MRLIPILLIFMFAMGCTTVRVYDQQGEEKIEVVPDKEKTEVMPEVEVPQRREKAPYKIEVATVPLLVIDIDRDFQYVPAGWPMGLSVGPTESPVLSYRPLKPLRREPQYKSQRPLYGYIDLGNSTAKRVLFAIDYIEPSSWVLWFDTNNNGDLTDDGPGLTPLEGQATYISVTVPVITASGSKIKRPYRLSFWIDDKKGNLVPRYYAVCHYRKKLTIGGKAYTAVVYEKSGHDALYKKSGLWIDLDGDGKMDKRKEHFKNNETLNIGGKKLKLKILHP